MTMITLYHKKHNNSHIILVKVHIKHPEFIALEAILLAGTQAPLPL